MARQLEQAVVVGCVQRAQPIGPVAADELGHAEQHRAGRAQAQRRADDEPEEHAEDMPVRSQQRMFDHMAQHLGVWQLAGIQVQPFGQQAPHLVVVAVVQRLAQIGEVVAELAEAQRQVEHHHIEGHRQQQAVVPDAQGDERHQQRRRQHRYAPHHPRMPRLAGVEVAPHPADPGHQPVMHPVVARQGFQLFDQQRDQDGEETHRQR